MIKQLIIIYHTGITTVRLRKVMSLSALQEVSYDLDFIEEPQDELLCLICMFPARDPLQNDCCGKVFCTTCITKYREEKRECPNCRDQGSHFKDRQVIKYNLSNDTIILTVRGISKP